MKILTVLTYRHKHIYKDQVKELVWVEVSNFKHGSMLIKCKSSFFFVRRIKSAMQKHNLKYTIKDIYKPKYHQLSQTTRT